MNVSISRMSSVRARWARMYSTAGTKRCVRKAFGQVLSDGSLMSLACQIVERGGAFGGQDEADAVGDAGDVRRDLDRFRLRAGLAVDVEHVVEDLEPRFALTLLLLRGESPASAAPGPRRRRPYPRLRPGLRLHLRPRLLDLRVPLPAVVDRIRFSRRRSRSFDNGKSGFQVNGASAVVSSRPSGP